ncbi:MAG: hypothetical protein K8R02_05190 [Anaerohalosphaeraceae bacterium]|nr:hypothetical protein [Anaerohalosphaeraceae bacterium]
MTEIQAVKDSADVPIDNLCLTSAGYFADSGLACGRKKGKPQAFDIDPKELVELSVKMASEKLAGILSPARVSGASDIIIESANKFTRIPEAMILSDAKSLDDMSLAGVMCEFRKLVSEGKGAADFAIGWRRKLDYQYWDARLKDDFRFMPVAKIAAKRFEKVKTFIRQLEETINAVDIK